ncbi:MAG: MmgE/PrpD family protein [Rhodospirillaceae bacterium]|nr:MmgE/PrpD family protein [Rhodospirillaceae bacterium]MBL24612.1 MmgE/PrpD family protein [Rhodospirillaceae bacterium]
MSANPTELLARFAANAKYEDLPDKALDLGRSSLLDASGVGLAGSASKGAAALNGVLSAYATEDGCPVIGSDLKLPAPFAAMANGNTVHADDFDDTLRADPLAKGYHGATHPTGPLLSALLSLTHTRKTSGKEFLIAYHVGVEFMAKINSALGPRSFASGFHPTAIMSAFGATAAAAKLKGLDEETLATSIGICASHACGLRANFGSMMKPYHPGHGAMSGLLAAEMAGGGFTASADAMGGPIGFLNAYGGSIDMAPLERLGDPWAIVDPSIWIKPYPSGNLTHPAMSNLRRFLEENDAKPEEVEKLSIQTKQSIYDTLIHHHPKTGLQSKFSMEFCLVKILIDGYLGLDDFSDEVVQRPEIQAMLANTKYTSFPDDEGKAKGYENYTTLVTFTLKDGREFTERADYGKGSHLDPMTYEEVADKARGCADYKGWPKDKFDALVDGWARIDDIEDVRDVTQHLFP